MVDPVAKKDTCPKTIKMAKKDGERWIVTTTIEMAKINYLKIKVNFS
jgi:hypothetical protein